MPARASLHTGTYVAENACWDNAHPYDGSIRSWAHRLRDAGHHTMSIGKLHFRSADDDNGFVEDVPLEPGCALTLELVDVHGNPFDPTSYGAATLSLRSPNGPHVQRKWYAMQGGTAVTARDALPGVGSAALAQAIPAGTYQLEVLANNEPRVRTLLQLRAERQVERIVVP